MKVLVMQYFKDERGEWHQPGNVAEFNDDELRLLIRRGAIKTIQTAMVEAPETRIVQFKDKRRARR